MNGPNEIKLIERRARIEARRAERAKWNKLLRKAEKMAFHTPDDGKWGHHRSSGYLFYITVLDEAEAHNRAAEASERESLKKCNSTQ